MTERAGEADSPRTTPVQWGLAGLFLALHVWLAWTIREPGITTRNDDALYLLLSRSLHSLRYLDAHLVGAPPHVQYPPGYPAILALVSALFGEGFDTLHLVGIGASTLALALSFDLVRRRWSPTLGLAVLLPAAVNSSLVRYAGTLIAEPLFMLCCCLALWLLAMEPVTDRRRALAVVAAIAAALTRSVGVTLIGAIFLDWLFERRYRPAAWLALAATLTVGLWLGWTVVAPTKVAGRSYVADVGKITALSGEQLQTKKWQMAQIYAVEHLPATLPAPSLPGTAVDDKLWILALLALSGAGLWLCWRRWRLGTLYLTSYGILLLLWRVTSPRFLAPLVPQLLTAVLVAALAVGGRRHRRIGWGLVGIVAALLTVQGSRIFLSDRRAIADCDRARAETSPGCFNDDQRSFFATARWAGAHTPDSVAFLTVREATFAYYSGRRTAYATTAVAADSSHFLAELAEEKVQYIVLGHTHTLEIRRLDDRLAQVCRQLELVEEFPPRGYLFRVAAGAPPAAGPSPACEAVARFKADSTPLKPQRK